MNEKDIEKIEKGLEKIGEGVNSEPLPPDAGTHLDEALKRARFDDKNRFANYTRRIAAGAAAVAVMVLSIWGTLKLMNVDITPGEDEIIAGQIQQDMIAAITVGGVMYEYDYADNETDAEIIQGDVYTAVEVGSEAFCCVVLEGDAAYEENQTKIAAASVTSTVLKSGTQIYECQGYSPLLRLCANGENGTLMSFTVAPRTSSLEADSTLSDYIDFTGMVKSAVITDNYPTVIGEITDAAALSEFESLLNAAVVTGEREYSFSGGEIIRVRLTLTDNSTLELLTTNGGTVGGLFAVIRFDNALADIITDHITKAAE